MTETKPSKPHWYVRAGVALVLVHTAVYIFVKPRLVGPTKPAACHVDSDCVRCTEARWCAVRRKPSIPIAEPAGECRCSSPPPVCHRDADCDRMSCEHGARCNLEGFVPPRCECHATADAATLHARSRQEFADHERASGLVCDEVADDFGQRKCRPIDGGSHDPGGDGGGPSP